VKPLKWNGNGASSPVGSYRVQTLGSKWEPLRDGYFMLPRLHGVVEALDTADEAKAVAQADYARRILSALSPSALAPDMSRELAEALRAIISRRVNGPDTYSILENARSALSRYEEASRG